MLEQRGLPLGHAGAGEVAIDALDAGHAILGHLGQQAFDHRRLRVVRIDQHRQALLVIVGVGLERGLGLHGRSCNANAHRTAPGTPGTN
jgi:hypothetical protein